MGSRSNHSGGFWDTFESGAKKLGGQIYEATHGGKKESKSEGEKPAKEKKEHKEAKQASAKPSKEPMKDIGSPEEAVALLRKNRGGRLP